MDGCFLVILLTLNKSKKKLTVKLPWEKPETYAFFVYTTASCHGHSTLVSQTYESLHQLWALPQHLAFFCFEWIGIQFFNSHTCDLRDALPRQRSLTHTHVTYAMPCHARGHLIPREAEDFPRGDNQSKHMPLPTYLDWLQPIHYNSRFAFIHVSIGKAFICGENFNKKYRAAATLINNHKLPNNCSLKNYTGETLFYKMSLSNIGNSNKFFWMYFS